jgi:hypothetical protein
MRNHAIAILKEKQSGMPVEFVHFYPPDEYGGYDRAEFASVEDFWAWTRVVFIPEMVQEAQAAERLHVETYTPLPVEAELFMTRQEGLVAALTADELVALANGWVAEVRDAVRPHFSGTLLAHSYARYEGSADPWRNMSFAGWDELGFSFFPECDAEATTRYMAAQLDGYHDVWLNSGRIPWGVGEVDLLPRVFEDLCGNRLDDVEAGVYQAVFDALDDAPMDAPLSAMRIASEYVRSPAGWAVIDAYFEAH